MNPVIVVIWILVHATEPHPPYFADRASCEEAARAQRTPTQPDVRCQRVELTINGTHVEARGVEEREER